MKRLAVIFGILITSLTIKAQILDSTSFKAYQLDILYGYEDVNGDWHTTAKETELGEAILYVENGKVYTTRLKDQLSSFQFYPDMEYSDDLYTGNDKEEPGYVVSAIDNSFSKCVFNVIELPYEDKFIIRIDYSNMRFGFFCRLTDETPFDEERNALTPTNLLKEGAKYETNPDYTDEELIEFFDRISNGQGKTIVNSIKVSFFAGQEIQF